MARLRLGAIIGALFFTSFSAVRAAPASALKARHVKHLADLRPSYDYIVVGGGTTGLTVADRLSESAKRQ